MIYQGQIYTTSELTHMRAALTEYGTDTTTMADIDVIKALNSAGWIVCTVTER